jgi:hypothetical protein
MTLPTLAAAACPMGSPKLSPLTASSRAVCVLYVDPSLGPPPALVTNLSFQPCTVRDFMNFLKYIELSAENLQFYLWFRDYSKRFGELPASEKALSPEWSGEKATAEVNAGPKMINAEAAAILSGSDFASDAKIDESEKTSNNPFFTPPRTPTSYERPEGAKSFDSYDDSFSTSRVDHTKRASSAFESAGLKWKPRKSRWLLLLHLGHRTHTQQ